MTEHDNATRASQVSERSGQRIVTVIYFVVVTIAGVMGYLLGSAGIRDIRSVKLLFLIELQPTPIGLAIYGMGTMGIGLGVALLFVAYVSRHFTK